MLLASSSIALYMPGSIVNVSLRASWRPRACGTGLSWRQSMAFGSVETRPLSNLKASLQPTVLPLPTGDDMPALMSMLVDALGSMMSSELLLLELRRELEGVSSLTPSSLLRIRLAVSTRTGPSHSLGGLDFFS
jgi:hypothetical protein